MLYLKVCFSLWICWEPKAENWYQGQALHAVLASIYQLWRPALCFELSLSISGKLPDILQCCVCTTLIAKCHHELSFGIPFGDYTTDPIEVQSHGILFQVVCNGMTSGFLKHVTMSNILANSFRLLCIHGWISGLNHNRAPTGLFCPLTLIPFG